ncbi:MAG TPA: hypothetical protein VFH58_16210 [Acidimicrobiales bacterium]|nr:hypothetical protein [Acidimicrobiales bacterium]
MSVEEPLTREEDDELRRLNFLAQTGALSERSEARVLELRLRDRRKKIRPPREFESLTEREKSAGPWSRFLRRN